MADYIGKPIGLQYLTWFPLLTDPVDGTATYDAPIKIGRGITATMTPELAEAILESDDGIEDQLSLLQGIQVQFNANQLSNPVKSALFGHVYDDQGGLLETNKGTPPWGAFAFRVRISTDGGTTAKYAWVVLYKGRFKTPTENFETLKKGGIDFKTHTVDGSFVPRDADGSIKYSIREDDTLFDSGVAAAWFDAVQEAGTPVDPIKVAVEQVGGVTANTDTTAIKLTFDKAVTGLTASHITIVNASGAATKGALTGAAKEWQLAITNPTEGKVYIKIKPFNGYGFPPSQYPVTIFAAP